MPLTNSFHHHHQVIIIGGGPAGLSVAYELARRGVEFVILEKGEQAGSSFQRFPKNIFFGPWLNNMLPGSKVALNWVPRRSTQPAYSHYLMQYCEKNHLPMIVNAQVKGLEQHSDGSFLVRTNQGDLTSDVVVNATGYFSKPFIPEYPGLHATSIPTMHVADYREPRTVREKLGQDLREGPITASNEGRRPKVLVVGKRLSAGETFCELHRAGYQVGLSFRGKLLFGPSRWQETLISPIVYVWERLAVMLRLKLSSFPRMAGGLSERLINQGHVRTYPNISHFEKDRVVFEDRSEESFDLVIFATGYRPAVDHLPIAPIGVWLKDMESTAVPGLFFLGVDGQRTYRSRFLRGLVEDSSVLAEMVAKRVASLRPMAKPTLLPVPIEERIFEPLEDEAFVEEAAAVEI
jgi:putative flavoprotein involved in K+ transport